MRKLIAAKTDMSSLENKFINSRVLTFSRDSTSKFSLFLLADFTNFFLIVVEENEA